MATSSFDDSQQDRLTSEASDGTTAAVTNLGDSFDEAKSALDLEQSQLGEVRRTRRPPISKLFSLQSDSDTGFLHDISSLVSGGVTALEDAFGKTAICRSIDCARNESSCIKFAFVLHGLMSLKHLQAFALRDWLRR